MQGLGLDLNSSSSASLLFPHCEQQPLQGALATLQDNQALGGPLGFSLWLTFRLCPVLPTNTHALHAARSPRPASCTRHAFLT